MVGRRRASQHTDFYGNFWQGSQQKQFSVRQTAFLQIPFPTNKANNPTAPVPTTSTSKQSLQQTPPLLLQWLGSSLTHNELNYSAFWPRMQPSGPFWSLSVWDWQFWWKSQHPPTGHPLMPEGAGWRQSLAAKNSQEKRGLAWPNWATAEQGEDKTFSN